MLPKRQVQDIFVGSVPWYESWDGRPLGTQTRRRTLPPKPALPSPDPHRPWYTWALESTFFRKPNIQITYLNKHANNYFNITNECKIRIPHVRGEAWQGTAGRGAAGPGEASHGAERTGRGEAKWGAAGTGQSGAEGFAQGIFGFESSDQKTIVLDVSRKFPDMPCMKKVSKDK